MEGTHITRNYRLFYDIVANMEPDEIKGLYEAITKLVVVGISLKDGDDPQLIFESLNSTGLALTTADKIRNYVLMKVESSESQERFYKEYWEPLEKLVSQKDLDSFIRWYLAVKMRVLPSVGNLYFEFKWFCEEPGSDLKDILMEMNRYGKYYREIVEPQENTVFRDHLLRIKMLKTNTCIPFLFDLMNARAEGIMTDHDVAEVLTILESYIVRREFCDLPTNVYNKMFAPLGGEVRTSMMEDGIPFVEAFKRSIANKKGKSRFPDDSAFEEGFKIYELYNAKSYFRKYVFERLENSSSKEKVAVWEQLDNNTLTIEHVMPQTLTDPWKRALGRNWEFIHTKYGDTIGNLTLSAYNSDYSNKSFQEKKNMPEKGFLCSKLEINRFLSRCDKWTEEEIKRRAQLLAQKALEIWWRPEGDKVDRLSGSWVEWTDKIDMTNKGISRIEVFGKKNSTRYIKDALKKVHKELYKKNASLYRNNELSWFSSTGSKFFQPFKIGEDAYIETNKNGNSQIATIKEIAKLFKLESRDIRMEVYSKGEPIVKEARESYSVKVKKETIGQMAYRLIADLIEKDALPETEVEKLKNKEYTKKVFPETHYPVFADNRDDNKGKGTTFRYRAKPLAFKGRALFVTTEWFEADRRNLENWYEHMLENAEK